MTPVLVLRPEPGASATAARAEARGLAALVAPIFTLRALEWDVPEPERFDALLLTSANAARLGGAGLARFLGHACYCVGEATGAAASDAGFDDVRTGSSDGAAVVKMMAEQGVSRALHLCGREHVTLGPPIAERRIVYAADPVQALPEPALTALRQGAVALLHSPRAAALFAMLIDRAGLARAPIRIAAISPAAAEAAGTGWGGKAAAAEPSDEAVLELAAGLCKYDGER